MHENWYGDKKVASEMKKEQLETTFEFGLEQIRFSACQMKNNGFRLKDYQK